MENLSIEGQKKALKSIENFNLSVNALKHVKASLESVRPDRVSDADLGNDIRELSNYWQSEDRESVENIIEKLLDVLSEYL
jgi:hypothetical protein